MMCFERERKVDIFLWWNDCLEREKGARATTAKKHTWQLKIKK
jgi:hypothetical protein